MNFIKRYPYTISIICLILLFWGGCHTTKAVSGSSRYLDHKFIPPVIERPFVMNMPINRQAILLYNRQQENGAQYSKPKPINTDSVIDRLSQVINSQANQITLYHERAIVAADRRYAEKVVSDSQIQALKADTTAKAEQIRGLQADKEIRDTLLNSGGIIQKYFPLIAGLLLIIGGFLGLGGKRVYDDRFAHSAEKNPTL